MRLIRIVLILFAVFFSVITLFAVLIYGFAMDNNATRAFNKTFPVLPAAMVSGKIVRIAEIEDRQMMYEQAVSMTSAGAPINGATERESILDSLIEQKIVWDMLAKRKILINSEELDDYYRHLAASFQTGRINEIFGVNEKDFKKNIVLSDLAEKKLHASLYKQDNGSKEYQRVLKIKKLVDEGLSFVEAAQSYSEDEESKYIGGDIGFKTEDELGPWLGPSARALAPSTTSEVIVSPEGYHILRLASLDSETVPRKLQIQQILIRGFDFEEYLEKQREKYRIYLFGR